MRPSLVANLALIAAYVAAGIASGGLKFPGLKISPLWLPTGIGLVGVLIHGVRVLPGIFLGHVIVNLSVGQSPLLAAGIALTGIAEVGLAAQLLRRSATTLSTLLTGIKPMTRFIAFVVPLSALAGAALAVAALALDGMPAHQAPMAAALWWTGDVVGMLIAVPLLAAWLTRGAAPALGRPADLSSLVLALAITTVVFFYTDVSRVGHEAFAYLILPFVVWAAIVLSPPLLATTSFLVTILAVAGTSLGRGPYAVSGSVTDVWLLQAFVATAAITSLTLKAAMEERRRNHQQLRHLADHDPLTGLPNRTSLHARWQAAAGAIHPRDAQAALLFLDLDDFKIVNDTLGHDFGDHVLVEVGHRLQRCVRQRDSIARLGGDEFVVVAPDVADVADAARLARSVIGCFDEPIRIESREMSLTCSIGIALYPIHGTDLNTLMRFADTAMYRAKARGKNTFEVFSADMNARLVRRAEIESALRGALQRGEFSLSYQVQKDVATGAMLGAEALLRWRNERLGPVPPDQFIGVAEETGLIVALGEWVIERACQQLRQWHDAGYRPPRVGVNLSPRQLDPRLVAHVRAALDGSGIEPGRLEVELTESYLMGDVERNISTLKELAALGVRISIDDFGTGYSSLSYLRGLPIHAVKIDRSFVRDIGTPGGLQVVSAIAALLRNLELRSVAEGVETEQQLELLRNIGCDEFQGYLHGKPVPADEFARRFLEPIAQRVAK